MNFWNSPSTRAFKFPFHLDFSVKNYIAICACIMSLLCSLFLLSIKYQFSMELLMNRQINNGIQVPDVFLRNLPHYNLSAYVLTWDYPSIYLHNNPKLKYVEVAKITNFSIFQYLIMFIYIYETVAKVIFLN